LSAILAIGVLAVVVPATASASPMAGPPTVPTLDWHSCDNGFQCATATVPLDYRQPGGATISIAVVRHLATDPAHRLGSLFVNGGGPSEQIDTFLADYSQIPAAFIADYDLISFDPRGFGYSTAVQCFPTLAEENAFLADLPGGFPVGAKQISTWESLYARFDATCARTNGDLLEHDSTADVARDMDLLRQAVGDPVLNYVGLSYGTGLGAIYANLFPNTVGRMVLDGNLDPVAWTTGDSGLPTFLREDSDEASSATLTAFLDLCGAAPTAKCAFSAGSAAATRAKFSTLLDQLAQHPVTVTEGSQQESCGYACGVGMVPLGQASEWADGAAVLQQLWVAATTGGTVTEPADESLRDTQAGSYVLGRSEPDRSGRVLRLRAVCLRQVGADGPAVDLADRALRGLAEERGHLSGPVESADRQPDSAHRQHR
jgi:pimeloyl-ACP methyl ester carboxylesterase